jgi:hypothetical protein
LDLSAGLDDHFTQLEIDFFRRGDELDVWDVPESWEAPDGEADTGAGADASAVPGELAARTHYA